MLSGTISGGVVLLAYLATIALGVRAQRRARGHAASRAWLGISIVLAALALDKALHGESLVVANLDRLAIAGGWYARREGLQVRAIAALAVAGLGAVGLIGWSLRRAGGATLAAASAAALLASFVLIRAVSLHRMDRLLGAGFGPLRISNVVELLGLGVISVGALAIGRARR